MAETKKQSSFVKETIARIKGDEAESIAIKNERLGRSAIKTQISVKEGETVRLESKIEHCEERLKDAIYPKTVINNDEQYVLDIVNAQADLDRANKALENNKKQLELFNKLLKERFE